MKTTEASVIEQFADLLASKVAAHLAPQRQVQERYLTAGELAEQLSRHVQTIHDWAAEGRIRFHVHGARRRFLLSEVLEDLKEIDTEDKKDQ